MKVNNIIVFFALYIQCTYFVNGAPKEGAVCRDKKRWCKYYKCNSAFVRKFCQKKCNTCPTVGSIQTKQCGIVKVQYKRSSVPRRIDSAKGQYPWHVGLFYQNQYFCGGTLISEKHVLTGAQCLAAFGGDNISNIKIVVGDYDISTNEGTEQAIIAKKMTLHHSYKINKRDHDIAILELERGVTLSNYVQPICLPKEKEELKTGTKCVMTGWGRKYPEFRYANKLEQSGVPVADITACRKRNSHGNNKITNNMFCTGYDDGKHDVSSCHGDSGGPIVCKTRDGSWKVYGVISWGSTTCNGLEKYTVNTKVSAYRAWMNKTMK